MHNLTANFTKKKNQGSPKNVFGNQKGNKNFDTFNSGMSSLWPNSITETISIQLSFKFALY